MVLSSQMLFPCVDPMSAMMEDSVTGETTRDSDDSMQPFPSDRN